MANSSEIFGLLVALGGLVCFSVSMSTNYWYTLNNLSDYGIFRACFPNTCVDLDWNSQLLIDSRLYLTRVVMVVSAAILGLGAFFQIISLCTDYSKKGCLLNTSGFFYFIGGVGSGVAAAILLGLLNGTNALLNLTGSTALTVFVADNIQYGYSFYLAWIAACVLIFGAIFNCVVGCSAKPEQVAPVIVNPQLVTLEQTYHQQSIPMSASGVPLQTNYYH